MGGGRYSTNNRVNAAAAAAAAQRAAALASGPAYPEEFASLASTFETDTDPFAIDEVAPVEAVAESTTTQDPYYKWLNSTEQGQRSNVTTTPDLLASLGMTADELAAGAAKRDRDNAAAVSSLTPEMLARLEGMDLSGLGNGMMGGKPLDVGTFARENQYKNITQYNPVGTAPEDMVVYDDLESSKAKAAKASREKEVGALLQEWTAPLKDLLKENPEEFDKAYNQLPLKAQLSFVKNEYDNGDLTEREYQDAFAEQWNASGQGSSLQFIEKYGWRVYAPDAIAQQGGQDPNGPMTWYETEGLFDNSTDFIDTWTPRVKESFDPTSIGRGLLAEPVLRAAAAIMTNGVSEGMIAAGKGLTGDTLHASDWVSMVAGAYNYGTGNAGALSDNSGAAAGAGSDPWSPWGDKPPATATIGGVPVYLTGTAAAINIDEDKGKDPAVDAAIAAANQLEQERLDRIEKENAAADAIAALDAEARAERDASYEAEKPDEVIPPPTIPKDAEGGGAEGGGEAGEGGDTGGDSGAAPAPVETTPAPVETTPVPVETTPPPADVTGDAGDVNGGTVNGGGTYDGKVLVDADGNESRFDDRQGTWDEFLETGRAVLIDSTDEAVWGKSGTFTVTIDGETNEIDWTKGTYNEVDPSVPVETVPPVQTPAPVETTPPVDEELLDEEAPIDFTTIGDLLDDTTVDPVTTPVDPVTTPVDPIEVTDPSTGTTDTGTATGNGTGTGTGTGDTVGTGDTTGTGTGGGDATGTGDGAGDGTGTGDGTGDGTGSGDGSGEGEGSGSGAGSGIGLGAGNGSRTTDSLFGDMLQLETQIGSTQDLLKPFSLAPVPAVMNYNLPQVNPIQQFVQQQQKTQLRNRPQGMLTNSEILKRYPF
jgi:hypothetical protein